MTERSEEPEVAVAEIDPPVVELDIQAYIPVTVRVEVLWSSFMGQGTVLESTMVSVPVLSPEGVEHSLGAEGMKDVDLRVQAALSSLGAPPWTCGCGQLTNRAGKGTPECARCAGQEVGL